MESTQITDHSLDSQSRFGEIVTVLAVFSVLSTAAVALRVFARWRLLHTFGLDDAVMMLAQCLAIGTAVCEGLEARYGLGRHQWIFRQEDRVPYMQAFYASVVAYNVGLCLVKLSILLQYRRIFVGSRIQHLILVLLVLFGAWTIALTFLLSLVCVPVAKFWDPTVGGHCLNELVIWYVVAGINLVTDFIVCGIPLPVISHLHLPRRQKLMLVAVFCLGFFTCIISIIRIPTLSVAAKTQDGTWDNVNAAIWSFLELNIAILAACLPTLRPILVKIMPRIFGSRSSDDPTDRPSGTGYISSFRHSRSGTTPGGSAWMRSKTAPSLNTPTSVIKDSDSTEELQSGEGWLPRRSVADDELGYSLQDLGRPQADGQDGKSYTIVVSAGGPDTNTETNGQQSTGFKGAIKATTMITQQVELNNGNKRRP
ncbi:hypothetical protein BR93DRAFT_911223 [Coniochaeta sp. PMI_546]|nr:hypothetical protein BR93DRAFT_911223 [Coniochaeta sp. PMI_546]